MIKYQIKEFTKKAYSKKKHSINFESFNYLPFIIANDKKIIISKIEFNENGDVIEIIDNENHSYTININAYTEQELIKMEIGCLFQEK